jgi:hypothetical protein
MIYFQVNETDEMVNVTRDLLLMKRNNTTIFVIGQ